MSRASFARLLILGAIWGTSFLFIKVALEGLSPTQIVLGRLLAGTAVVWVALAARRERLDLPSGMWLHLVVLAVVANVVPFLLFSWAEERITSGMAGLLNGTTPLFTLLFAVGFLPSERPTTARVTGLLLGFVGVVTIVAPWESAGSSSLVGQVACLLAAACYGMAFIYTRRLVTPRGVTAMTLSGVQLGISTVVMVVVTPIAGRSPMRLELDVVVSVLALGALGTGLAYLLYYQLIHDVGATSASMVTYLVPVFAVTLGVVVLDEPLTWNLFVGAAVVLLGVAVAEERLSRSSSRAPVTPSR